jgi:hypothetical protein
MYRCDRCTEAVAPGVKQQRAVAQDAPARYPPREKAYRRKVKKRLKWFDDPGGTGRRIVREEALCPTCARDPNR